MPFQYQPANFNFIGQAAQQFGQAAVAYDNAQTVKVDDAQAEKAYEMLVEVAKHEYKQATGTEDDVKAAVFAGRYFMPKFKKETASEMVQRLEKADTSFKSALASIKAEKQTAANKATSQDVSTKLRGEIPQRAMDAIKAGAYLSDINSQFGTSISEDEYNQYAGIAPPKPFTHVPGTADFKAPAAADKPVAPIPKPISYQQGRKIVEDADLPAADKKQFDPNLESMADRDIGKTPIEGQTAENYFSTIQRSGYPLTENSKKVGDAILNEDKLAQKTLENQRKANGSANSLLQSYLKDHQFRQQMAFKYGEKGSKAAEYLDKLQLRLNALNNERYMVEINPNADFNKPDRAAYVIEKDRDETYAEIDRVKMLLPGFNQLVDDFASKSSTYRVPNIVPKTPIGGSGATTKSTPPVTTGKRPPLSSFGKP